jgi:hypothetical protein
MTWTMSSGIRNNVKKIAAAGVLLVGPAIAVSFPAYASTGTPDAHAVILAPPPADPPPPPPPPPPGQQTQGEYYNPNDYNDWWPYAGTGSF